MGEFWFVPTRKRYWASFTFHGDFDMCGCSCTYVCFLCIRVDNSNWMLKIINTLDNAIICRCQVKLRAIWWNCVTKINHNRTEQPGCYIIICEKCAVEGFNKRCKKKKKTYRRQGEIPQKLIAQWWREFLREGHRNTRNVLSLMCGYLAATKMCCPCTLTDETQWDPVGSWNLGAPFLNYLVKR